MALDHSDERKCVIVISMVGLCSHDRVKLDQVECTDYAWITREQIKDYVLIEGIQEELELAFRTIEGLCKS
jgi:hypothetical protein